MTADEVYGGSPALRGWLETRGMPVCAGGQGYRAAAAGVWAERVDVVVAAVTEHARHPAPPGVIELTCNEIQHLFAALVCRPASDHAHRLRWSWWRRRQQARARACHYRRQAAQQP